MTPDERAHDFASKLLALSGLEISPNALRLAEKYATTAICQAEVDAYEAAAQIAEQTFSYTPGQPPEIEGQILAATLIRKLKPS
jgi:hypothetical protein